MYEAMLFYYASIRQSSHCTVEHITHIPYELYCVIIELGDNLLPETCLVRDTDSIAIDMWIGLYTTVTYTSK